MSVRVSKGDPFINGLAAIKNHDELQAIISEFQLNSVAALTFQQNSPPLGAAAQDNTWKNPYKKLNYIKIMTLRQQLMLTRDKGLRKQLKQKLSVLLCGCPAHLEAIDLKMMRLKIELPDFEPNKFTHIHKHITFYRLLALYDEYQQPGNAKNEQNVLLVLHHLYEFGQLARLDTKDFDPELKNIIDNFNDKKANWQQQQATIIALRQKYDDTADKSKKSKIAVALGDLLGVSAKKIKKAPHHQGLRDSKMALCDKAINEHDIYFPGYNDRQKCLNAAIKSVKKLYKLSIGAANQQECLQQIIILLIQDKTDAIGEVLANITQPKIYDETNKILTAMQTNMRAASLKQYKKLRKLFQFFLEHRYLAATARYCGDYFFDKDFYEMLKIFNNTVNHDIKNDIGDPVVIGGSKYKKIDRIQELFIYFEQENPADPQQCMDQFSVTVIKLFKQIEEVNFKDFDWSISNKDKLSILHQLKVHFNNSP